MNPEEKYQHICTVGNYPQGNITREFLATVVNNYSVDFRLAPIWLGHVDSGSLGNQEPLALGWIKSLKLDGDKLYAQFMEVSGELQYLVDNNYIKYCSCEFYNFGNKQDGDLYYLKALGLTNRPAVSSLEPLSFPHSESNLFTYDESKCITLTLNNTNKFNSKKIIMNEFLISIAKKFSLETDKFHSDSELADAINLSFDDKMKNADATQFTARITELESELTKANNERAGMLIQFALDSKKILPVEKDSMLKFAMLDFDACKKLVDAKPVNSIFAKDVVHGLTPDVVDIKDPKFFTADNKEVTYEMCLKDETLEKRFTTEELMLLKSKSQFKSK